MADRLKVVITDDQKEIKVQTGIRMLLRRCCHAVLVNENFKGSAEIGITFTDNKKLEKLSVKHFGTLPKGEAFSVRRELADKREDYTGGVKRLGHVYISFEKAYESAQNTNDTIRRRLALLTAEGVLELLGYKKGDSITSDKTERCLYQLGLPVSTSTFYYEQ